MDGWDRDGDSPDSRLVNAYHVRVCVLWRKQGESLGGNIFCMHVRDVIVF